VQVENCLREDNRGHQEGSFVIVTNLSVLRSGALNHRLPNAFSVLDQL
jgi:hypothetical protein